MNTEARHNRVRRGFTLVELLIVILIMAILMAVALPLYVGAVSDAQVKTCRANMQTIANAEQAYKLYDSAHHYTSDITQLYTYTGDRPRCPLGGAYSVEVSNGSSIAGNGLTVPDGGIVIRCSAEGHLAYAPGVDVE